MKLKFNLKWNLCFQYTILYVYDFDYLNVDDLNTTIRSLIFCYIHIGCAFLQNYVVVNESFTVTRYY